MGNKIVIFASGMLLGCMILIVNEDLYKDLKVAKKNLMKKINAVKKDAETSLEEIKEKVDLKTDDALDTVNNKIDDLIQFVDQLDVSKVKGKSRMALLAMKQKIMTLKQN